MIQPRRISKTVEIGHHLRPLSIGEKHPIAIQSMTDTPTENRDATVRQIVALGDEGSEIVRITVNSEKAALAVPEVVSQARKEGFSGPIVGDFHFNGHRLLTEYPQCASALDKYRINPGNVGTGRKHSQNFATIIEIAKNNGKAVRIGVNAGSLDQKLLAARMDLNQNSKNPQDASTIMINTMVESALLSAEMAIDLGLAEDKIVLSVKMSHLQDMVSAYEKLAEKCAFPLHLGLTEAGMGDNAIIASTAALSILLQKGIGDTIRVSLTPRPGEPRTKEVAVAKAIIQSLGVRSFSPSIVSCPGCGRTTSDGFRKLAQDVEKHLSRSLPFWKKQQRHGIENLKIAVMGCVVNGPGESKAAHIGISLPGSYEEPKSVVYVDGKPFKAMQGDNMASEFLAKIDAYVEENYPSKV